MYMGGQVIYDLDNDKPFIMGDVWDPEAYPEHNTHMICTNHDPRYIRQGVTTSKGNKTTMTFDTFKCETCGRYSYVSPKKNDNIYTGEGKTQKEQIANATRRLKAGQIKPAHTLSEVLEREHEDKKRVEARKELSPEEREQERKDSDRTFFEKGFALYLRFHDHHIGEHDFIMARDWDSYEYGFRNPHNLILQEQARLEYLSGIKKLQAKLSAKYNPQFIDEDPGLPPLEYPERRSAIDKVWDTDEKLKLYTPR